MQESEHWLWFDDHRDGKSMTPTRKQNGCRSWEARLREGAGTCGSIAPAFNVQAFNINGGQAGGYRHFCVVIV